MELLYELLFTISLSLIFTSLFIRLFSTSPNVTDNDHDMFFSEKTFRQERQYYPSVLNSSVGVGSEVKGGQMYAAETEETLEMDKFQCVPINDEVIKLEECHDEGKTLEFYDSEKGEKSSLKEENDDCIAVKRGQMYAVEAREMLLMDKFHCVLIKDELIKLEECHDDHEGKSKVEREVNLGDVEIVDGKKGCSLSLKEENGDHEVRKRGQMYAVKTEEILQMDEFQYVPIKKEVIMLEECYDEDKSKVEFHKEEVKLRDDVVDSRKCHNLNLKEENDDSLEVKGGQMYADNAVKFEEIQHTNIHEEVQEKDEIDSKMYEIEIENVEEDEEIMDDWEEIGREDFEEIIGIKEGLYDFNVSFSGLNNFDVVNGK